MANATTAASSSLNELESGYDLPVYGLGTGEFLQFHITALSCIVLSLTSSVTVATTAFREKGFRRFFSWSKGERFVIYLTICDGFFNLAHSLDHAHYLVAKDHVRPPWLCEIYSFILGAFVLAQTLMVNVIAVCAFVLINFEKHIHFGSKDWILLLYTFGVPFIGNISALLTDQLGPNGAFCAFDAVKGKLASILLTTAPVVLVLVVNVVLYVLTWSRIQKECKKIKTMIGQSAATAKSPMNAAKSMTLFVIAFFVQWWATAIYGVWQLFDSIPPLILFKFVTTFTNLGGVLNGIVYLIIRRRIKRDKRRRSSVMSSSGVGRGSVSSHVDSTMVSQI